MEILLKAFKDAAGTCVSGDALAAKLGISRVSVFNRLEKLRAAGFEFRGTTGQGYRMTGVPAKIFEPWLKVLCGNVNAQIFVEESCESTNSDVSKMLAGTRKIGVPVVIFANKQNAGRGRIDRKWASDSAGNIYVSFGFSPMIAPAKMANFTPWLGVCVCKMLNEKFGVSAKIKWPNDLWVGDKKISGTLTEVHMDSDFVRGVIFGIGLNVLSVPEELAGTATAMARERDFAGTLDVNAVGAELVRTILTGAEAFFAGTFSADLAKFWPQFDLLFGRKISAIYGNEKIVGIARGLDEQGSLLVENAAGTLLHFSAGDASLVRGK